VEPAFCPPPSCPNYREDISGPVPVSANSSLSEFPSRSIGPRTAPGRLHHATLPQASPTWQALPLALVHNKPPAACRQAAPSKARSPRERPYSPTGQDKTRDTSSCQMNDGQFLPLATRVQKPSFPHEVALSPFRQLFPPCDPNRRLHGQCRSIRVRLAAKTEWNPGT